MADTHKLKHFARVMSGFTIIAFSLAACLETPEQEPVTQDSADANIAQSPDASTPASAPSPQSPADTTVGGDGSQLVLNPLDAADLEGTSMTGELACSFTTVTSSAPLLLARGNVADEEGRAQFAIKIGDYVEQGLSREAGGYDAIIDGSSFGTRGMTIELSRTSETPAGNGESPPYPAQIVAMRADGAERTIAGLWTCGP